MMLTSSFLLTYFQTHGACQQVKKQALPLQTTAFGGWLMMAREEYGKNMLHCYFPVQAGRAPWRRFIALKNAQHLTVPAASGTRQQRQENIK
jgi:hypothetical protein